MGDIAKAKNRLLVKEPFFGYLLMKLAISADNTIFPPTMQTNGRFLKFHPEFVKKKDTDFLVVVLIHELLHCVLDHPRRGMGHIEEISQYAADYVVNDYIINKTPFDIPEGEGLYDPRFQNMGYEEVYRILLEEQFDPEKVQVSINMGSFTAPPLDAQGKPAKHENGLSEEDFWKASITEAANLAKTIGHGLSKCAEELVELVAPPQLPWQNLLHRYLDKMIKSRNDWSRPNRRYAHTGLFLPQKRSRGMRHLIIAIDTSASLDNNEFQQIIAEVNRILLQLKPEKLTVIHCDSAIRAVEEYSYADLPFTTSMKGRGYTEFFPVFHYIEEEKLNPNCLIYFTDLYGDFNFPEPQYNVLWVNTNYQHSKMVAPFGETIGLNIT